jgi:hypothetical protein
MVHGRARHSPSQGFIENRNKSVVRFLVKWCMCNKTQIWWLGLPFATLHINSQVNSGTKLSPFHYLYGSEGSTRGIGHLCIPKDRLQRLTNECELNAMLKIGEGILFEWVGRERLMEPLVENDMMCSPIRNDEVLEALEHEDTENSNTNADQSGNNTGMGISADEDGDDTLDNHGGGRIVIADKQDAVLGNRKEDEENEEEDDLMRSEDEVGNRKEDEVIADKPQDEVGNRKEDEENEEEDDLMRSDSVRDNTRKRTREIAKNNQVKMGSLMKKRALKKGGGECQVGDVVSFGAADADRNRLTASNVVGVVVERDDTRQLNTLGLKTGALLKDRYPDAQLKKIQTSRESMGLENVFQTYCDAGAAGMKRVAARQAIIHENRKVAELTAMSYIVCRCQKGNCRNCKCSKNGRHCTDKCHRGEYNSKCENCIPPPATG